MSVVGQLVEINEDDASENVQQIQDHAIGADAQFAIEEVGEHDPAASNEQESKLQPVHLMPDDRCSSTGPSRKRRDEYEDVDSNSQKKSKVQ
ncbi:hypothetical protein PVAP13_6NG254737 [Panicum virgatum]|uniref:Uncharacterized protein n=1 Tax=Panicum virgatum TaxID=38727 RepID=A0A8T0R4D0_PANVG|nr:hypothetical protein PVAP13_6NG254737 [Panicum virgatum]